MSADVAVSEVRPEPVIAVCPPETVVPTPEEAEAIRKEAQEIFDYFDLDKSGYVDVSEVENIARQWIEKCFFRGLTDEQVMEAVAELIKQRDENADSKITFDEVYNAITRGETFIMPRKLSPEEADEAKKSAQDLFDQLDLDKSGYIEASDLEKIYTKWCADVGVVSTPEDDAELKELIAECFKRFDLNADTKITFDELFKVLLGMGYCEI